MGWGWVTVWVGVMDLLGVLVEPAVVLLQVRLLVGFDVHGQVRAQEVAFVAPKLGRHVLGEKGDVVNAGGGVDGGGEVGRRIGEGQRVAPASRRGLVDGPTCVYNRDAASRHQGFGGLRVVGEVMRKVIVLSRRRARGQRVSIAGVCSSVGLEFGVYLIGCALSGSDSLVAFEDVRFTAKTTSFIVGWAYSPSVACDRAHGTNRRSRVQARIPDWRRSTFT